MALDCRRLVYSTCKPTAGRHIQRQLNLACRWHKDLHSVPHQSWKCCAALDDCASPLDGFGRQYGLFVSSISGSGASRCRYVRRCPCTACTGTVGHRCVATCAALDALREDTSWCNVGTGICPLRSSVGCSSCHLVLVGLPHLVVCLVVPADRRRVLAQARAQPCNWHPP